MRFKVSFFEDGTVGAGFDGGPPLFSSLDHLRSCVAFCKYRDLDLLEPMRPHREWESHCLREDGSLNEMGKINAEKEEYLGFESFQCLPEERRDLLSELFKYP